MPDKIDLPAEIARLERSHNERLTRESWAAINPHDEYPGDDPFGNYGEREVTPRAAEIKRKMVSLDAITAVLEVNYLIKGWLSVNGLSVIYGPSHAGKTFVAISLAMHLAAGVPWMGCKVNQGPVFYIAAEGGAGVLNRLAAFKSEFPHMASAPFTLLPIGVDLHAKGDAQIAQHWQWRGWDFRELMIGMRQQLEIRVFDQPLAGTGQLLVVAWMRADVQVATPKSFAKLTGIIPA